MARSGVWHSVLHRLHDPRSMPPVGSDSFLRKVSSSPIIATISSTPSQPRGWGRQGINASSTAPCVIGQWVAVDVIDTARPHLSVHFFPNPDLTLSNRHLWAQPLSVCRLTYRGSPLLVSDRWKRGVNTMLRAAREPHGEIPVCLDRLDPTLPLYTFLSSRVPSWLSSSFFRPYVESSHDSLGIARYRSVSSSQGGAPPRGGGNPTRPLRL
jgi:hypothetical protein